ncbi:hypothetical protein LWP59_01330 [Amycolatopsis acidiphila]|uniref:Uncharacterized protein n=1 Tax=Amycolatopsis acidiphila TaxID=715473 RepID=A0A558AMW5_9PSEU|nr:hypothetical protein [Amycolatopsis acidiphila]TVT25616.1 hypothetical protein FNH06_02075 [Amycolatopsis acidiphila]UIJ60371.1 hypothetical protein LWP59_01330 [Amycolatopsis acidiphila]GHG90500.1 hypothetical protein GCM10017788_66030 [Amycolatopsis acidiphila]
MGTVHYSAPADIPADEAFAFMSDAPDLPRILPGTTDEARVRADEAARRLTWGTESDGDDHGELRVVERGANQCEIEISVTTQRADTDQVKEELAQAVAALAHKASADADEERAGPGGGWA